MTSSLSIFPVSVMVGNHALEVFISVEKCLSAREVDKPTPSVPNSTRARHRQEPRCQVQLTGAIGVSCLEFHHGCGCVAGDALRGPLAKLSEQHRFVHDRAAKGNINGGTPNNKNNSSQILDKVAKISVQTATL